MNIIIHNSDLVVSIDNEFSRIIVIWVPWIRLKKSLEWMNFITSLFNASVQLLLTGIVLGPLPPGNC